MHSQMWALVAWLSKKRSKRVCQQSQNWCNGVCGLDIVFYRNSIESTEVNCPIFDLYWFTDTWTTCSNALESHCNYFIAFKTLKIQDTFTCAHRHFSVLLMAHSRCLDGSVQYWYVYPSQFKLFRLRITNKCSKCKWKKPRGAKAGSTQKSYTQREINSTPSFFSCFSSGRIYVENVHHQIDR